MILVNYNKDCPCNICLIKGMCIVACEEFKNFKFKDYKLYNENQN